MVAGHRLSQIVMPALVAGIHVFFLFQTGKTWMAGTSPAMTPSFSSQKIRALRKNRTYSERWMVSTR
jgi:hypothetical protein